jgi:hypothetical protein
VYINSVFSTNNRKEPKVFIRRAENKIMDFSFLQVFIILTGYGKGKGSPCAFLIEHNAMKAYWGSGGITSRILETPAALPPGKEPLVPIG